ncbi:uncharacterized protein LOC134825120 isoform X2 [Bolinopsis microptera]|uniref:uncharacterized protein LOC134825120 isoform X2 n=1 Tax=Bolinopsis microptera TaxID=2820187 RepID=UPI003079A23E
MIFIILTILGLGLNVSTQDGLEIQNHLAVEKRAQHEQFGTNWCRHEEKRIHLNNEGTGEEAGYCVGNGYIHAEFKTLDEAKEAFDRRPMDTCGGISLDIDLKLYTLRSGPVVLEESFINEVAWTPCTEEEQIKVDADAGRNDNQGGWDVYDGRYLGGYCTSDYAYDTLDECKEAYKHTNPPGKCGGITYENVKAGEYVLKVMCDDTSTIYIDGQKKDVPGPNNWGQLATLKIPASTNTIGIQCHNGGGSCGITAEVTDETGQVLLVSDNSWKCSNKEEDGWTADGFTEDDSWKPAAENRPFITGCYLSDERAWKGMSMDKKVIWTENKDSTVYCRRELPQGKYTLRQGRDPQDSPNGAVTWYPMRNGSWKEDSKTQKAEKKKVAREKERKAKEKSAEAKFTADTEIDISQEYTNLALNQQAEQKDTVSTRTALKAVDGNRDGNWSGKSLSSTRSKNGWWRVTLSKVYYISYIDVYNRMDKSQERLRNAQLSVDGTLIGTIPQVSGVQKYTFPVDKDGQVVQIKGVSGQKLQLAEVEVYGRDSESKSGEYVLKVMCDDTSTIYIDGEKKDVPGPNNWGQLATLKIPASTNTIGIQCHNGGGSCGITAEVTDETGQVLLVSDNSWKCSNKEEDGWTADGFTEDDSWKPAAENQPFITGCYLSDERAWIGMSMDKKVIWTENKDSTVYCRRELPQGKYTLRQGRDPQDSSIGAITWFPKKDGSGKGQEKDEKEKKKKGKRERERKAEIERVAKEIEDRKAERKLIEKEKADEKREREQKAEIERVAKEIENKKAERKFIEKEKADEKREGERKAEIERVAKEIEDRKAKRKFIEKEKADEKREGERKAEIERVAKEIEDRKAERKFKEKEEADEKREGERKAEIERVAKEIEDRKAARKFIEKEKSDEKREEERKAEIERVAKEIEDRKAERKFIEKEKSDEKREGERKAEIERVAKEIEDRKAERKFIEKEKADEKREGERKAEIERVAKEIEDRKAKRKFIEREKADEKREGERKAEIERVAKEIEDRKAERKFIEKEKADEKREGERKAEIERVAKEIEDRKAERKFIEKEKANEKRERERKAEIERVAKELEDRKAERKLIEKEKAGEKRERERKAEIERVAKEIEDKKAKVKAEKERKAKEESERQRKEREQADKERKEREQADRERKAREKAEKEREQADKERKEREQADRERKAREKAEKERAESERTQKEKSPEALNNGRYCGWREIPNTKLNMGLAGRIMNRLNLEDAKALCLKTETCQGVACKNFEECLLSSCTSKGRKYFKGWTTYVPIPCEFETEGFGKKAYVAFQDAFCGFKACLVDRFNYYFGM